MQPIALHPVEGLFAAMAEVAPYPEKVIPVPNRIAGTAFFPGGSGLWGVEPGRALPAMPVCGVMVLGHDFHSEDAFARSFAAGTEVPGNPTWQNLLRLLQEVRIPLERCFFTNAYMGLREGAATTGKFPGSRDRGFVERCRRFLRRQLPAQRPTVVLTLGTYVPAFVAPLAAELQGWEGVQSFDEIDRAGPVVHGVTFSGTDAPACSVVALTHPCLRPSNIRRRRYRSLKGHAAEVALIREAMEVSGFAEA
jgi:uracil-DNA glycosylase